MKIYILFILFLSTIVLVFQSKAEEPKDYAFFVKVQTDTIGKPKIILSWSQDTAALGYQICWKYKHNGVWSDPLAILPPNVTSFVDSTIRIGTGYEYQIKKKLSTPNDAFAYVYAGINLPEEEWHGKLLLFVDETVKDSLDYELQRFTDDLTGDGWEVIRHDGPRTENYDKYAVMNIKNIILRDYSYYQKEIKSIILFGRIAVPYSGDISIDDHDPDHRGAWAADLFYGEIDGIWTDTLIDLKVATRQENWNVPGDGKFDQTMIPSDVDIPLGRIDFYNLPRYAKTEIELLRTYLNKDHNYRHKKITVNNRALIDDGFGMISNESFATDAWLNFYSLFDSSNVVTGDFRYGMKDSSYLWAYGCNSGSYSAIYLTAYDFEMDSVKYNAVFTILFGSYCGDWDSQLNILRAIIGSEPSVLTCIWAGRPFWFLHRMGLGETIGDATLLSQNNQYLYESTGLYGYRYTHVALMGDPTLKMYNVAPASEFLITQIISKENSRIVKLTWYPSPDTVVGYNIYRMKDGNGEYKKLNDSPVTENYFIDSSASLDRNKYMLRALKLEQSPTGTFYNLSQGIYTETMNLRKDLPKKIVPAFSIYPNPAKENLTIAINNGSSSYINISIFDVLGKKIKEMQSNDNGNIIWNLIGDNGRRVSAGLYFIKIQTLTDTYISKIQIQ